MPTIREGRSSEPKKDGEDGTGEELRFEDAMEQLEAIVTRLERGELGLEESLRLYEQGVGLARRAQAQLEVVEGKITALLADGQVTDLTDLDRGQALEGSL